MPDPFRQLATTPTTAALAKLGAMPVDPIHFACGLVAEYRVVPDADANRAWCNVARDQKLAHIGAAAEGFTGNLQKQIFVDEAKTTQAHIATTHYFFATYFESGKCILTFDRASPITQSNDNLKVRSGTSDFAYDYQAHCQAVGDWVDQDEVAIAVHDIDTAVALGRFYYRHVIGLSAAAKIVFSNPATIGVIIFLLFVFSRFL
jgi:hypothetical protein